jgi:hypothetical protein
MSLFQSYEKFWLSSVSGNVGSFYVKNCIRPQLSEMHTSADCSEVVFFTVYFVILLVTDH